MATWQYDIHLLPKQELLEVFSHIPTRLEASDLDYVALWANTRLPSDYESRILTFLRRSESWDRQIKIWGELESNRLEIILSDGEVLDIYIRLDVRKLSREFLENIISFAKFCNCVILTPDHKLIEPSVDELLSRLKSSESAKYVRDPRKFLKRIKQT